MNKRIAIIGAGPAGLAAAIALRCEGYEALIISPEFGGRMNVSPKIENILGFPFGVSGEAFNKLCLEQVTRLGVELAEGRVSQLIHTPASTRPWEVALGADGPLYIVSAVVLAMGMDLTAPPRPSAPAPGHDGYHVVVGGGDAAVQVALGAAEAGTKTILAVRGESLDKCSAYLRPRVEQAANLTVRYATEATDLGNGNVGLQKTGTPLGLVLRNSTLQTLLGAKPVTTWADVTLDPQGFILTDSHFQTSRPGVFAAGDVRAGSIKRIHVAAGEGLAVGHIVAAYLRGKKK